MPSQFLSFFTKKYHDPQIKSRMAGLDTLRALAIILVFFFHYPRINGQTSFGLIGNVGWCGVDLFFVLSGYLIGNQILSALAKGKDFSIGRFYYRRLMRTLPDYWFVLALYFLVPPFREWHQPLTTPFWQFFTFTQNFNLKGGAFSHAWSLCVEEQFYLIFPFIALWLFHKKAGRLALGLIISVIIFETILRALLWLHYFKSGLNPVEALTTIYYPTYTRLIALVLGISIALIKNFDEARWLKISQKGNWFLLFGLIGTAIAFYCYRDFIAGLGFYQTVFAYPLLDLSFALLVLAALCPSSLLYQVKIPFAATIAAWSYAAYLIQKQMMSLSNEILLERWGIASNNWIAILTAIIVTLLASYLLYTWIETPFLKLREKKE